MDDQQLPAGENQEELESGEETREIRETVDVPPISFSSNAAGDTLMATQAIINRQSSRLDALKEDVKKLNDSLKSILDNDAELSQTEEEVKALTRKQKERKTKLQESAESMQLKYKVKETKEQIKELEESLNNHLINYFQMTGTKVFDTDSGEQREFKITARVMGKKAQTA